MSTKKSSELIEKLEKCDIPAGGNQVAIFRGDAKDRELPEWSDQSCKE